MLEPGMLSMLAEGTWQSICMTVAITAISYLIGIPLAEFLLMSDKNGIHPMASLNWIVGGIVNILRSVPFLILMITIQPFTRMIVGGAMIALKGRDRAGCFGGAVCGAYGGAVTPRN